MAYGGFGGYSGGGMFGARPGPFGSMNQGMGGRSFGNPASLPPMTGGQSMQTLNDGYAGDGMSGGGDAGGNSVNPSQAQDPNAPYAFGGVNPMSKMGYDPMGGANASPSAFGGQTEGHYGNGTSQGMANASMGMGRSMGNFSGGGMGDYGGPGQTQQPNYGGSPMAGIARSGMFGGRSMGNFGQPPMSSANAYGSQPLQAVRRSTAPVTAMNSQNFGTVDASINPFDPYGIMGGAKTAPAGPGLPMQNIGAAPPTFAGDPRFQGYQQGDGWRHMQDQYAQQRASNLALPEQFGRYGDGTPRNDPSVNLRGQRFTPGNPTGRPGSY